MKYPFQLLVFVILFVFSSCMKKDKPITLPAKGDGTVMQVDMGENYEYQYYINLDLEKIVYVSKTNLWHLAFQSGSNQNEIFLNGGQGMACYNTFKTDFSSVGFADTTIAFKNWQYDAFNGNPDSSAIGNWQGKNMVYLVKLDKTNSKIRKLKITYVDAFEYIITIGDINSSAGVDITIPKNKDQNYTYFSFDFLTTVDKIEPLPTDKWDFVFTTFNHTFYDQNPPLPYIVTGALLNPAGTLAYKDSLHDFNTIDLVFAKSVPLSTRRDEIGFDWKSYDMTQSLYTVVSKYNYIIKNTDGRYYKLHFLDFYSSQGIKGSPKFEFKLLQ